MEKTNTDLTLEQCDELRKITEKRYRGMDDEDFERTVEAIAETCKGDFSAANWRRSL